MRRDQVLTHLWTKPDGDECCGAGDEAVEDDWQTPACPGKDHADEPRDLEPTHLAENVEWIVRIGAIGRQCLADHGHFPVQAPVVEARAAAGHPLDWIST